ncbi:hypothetical protein ABID19_000002 [Mesorhizobium robiniae]|uniref:Transposase n=1 Tax=Mesorhizobium robiniae TaxID=559315 RepID=A0ABV2GFA3_9HYPH
MIRPIFKNEKQRWTSAYGIASDKVASMLVRKWRYLLVPIDESKGNSPPP